MTGEARERVVEVTAMGLSARVTLPRVPTEESPSLFELCEWGDSIMAALCGEPIDGTVRGRAVTLSAPAGGPPSPR